MNRSYHFEKVGVPRWVAPRPQVGRTRAALRLTHFFERYSLSQKKVRQA